MTFQITHCILGSQILELKLHSCDHYVMYDSVEMMGSYYILTHLKLLMQIMHARLKRNYFLMDEEYSRVDYILQS